MTKLKTLPEKTASAKSQKRPFLVQSEISKDLYDFIRAQRVANERSMVGQVRLMLRERAKEMGYNGE